MHISLQEAFCSLIKVQIHKRYCSLDLVAETLPLSGAHQHMDCCDRDRLTPLGAAPALFAPFRLPSSRCSWLAAPSSLTSCVRAAVTMLQMCETQVLGEEHEMGARSHTLCLRISRVV